MYMPSCFMHLRASVNRILSNAYKILAHFFGCHDVYRSWSFEGFRPVKSQLSIDSTTTLSWFGIETCQVPTSEMRNRDREHCRRCRWCNVFTMGTLDLHVSGRTNRDYAAHSIAHDAGCALLIYDYTEIDLCRYLFDLRAILRRSDRFFMTRKCQALWFDKYFISICQITFSD